MKITIAGTGYVGLSNAMLLSQNHEVIALDIIPEKIEQLNNKISPIVDAEIEDFLVNKNLNFTATLDKQLAYKNASFEAVDLPLIKYVAQTGKPMIISTGMADAQEIQEAIEAAREGGCKELAILHCVSAYPALASDYNLRTLADMRQKFGLVTGLSDHTIDNTTAITSVALGASIIEKHVTLDRNGGGPDDSFSLEEEGLKGLCIGAKTAWESLGEVDYGRKSSEQSNIKFRRSLYFVKNIQKGEVITREHVKSIRPGYGLAPKNFEKIIGLISNRDITQGSPVKFEDLR
jgi:sialic acid synthase SpsE